MTQKQPSLLSGFDLSLLQIWFINISLIIYPATVLFVPKVNGLIFGVLVLVGIIFVIKQRHISLRVNHQEKLLYFSISIFFFIVLLITINAGFVYKSIGKYLHLLLAIPVYIYLRHVGIRLIYLWYGLVVGSVVTACIAVYDVWLTDTPKMWVNGDIRAMGITHPIIFGDLALIMGCMSIASLGWFKQRASWQIVFPFIALLSGVFASVLSQSRGAWLAVPFLIIVLFWYVKPLLSIKLKIALAVSIVLFLAAMYAIPQTKVSYQIERTINSLQAYSDSDITSNKRASSVGARLEMWQASWKIFLDNPLIGVGWGNYLNHAKILVEKGERNRSAASFDHPHNQFFMALASGGILGFSATLMLFLVPARLFIQYIRHKKTDDVGRLALAGLIFIVAYMAFGLSEPLLDRSRSVNFFAFYLVVFMAAIHGGLKQATSDVT